MSGRRKKMRLEAIAEPYDAWNVHGVTLRWHPGRRKTVMKFPWTGAGGSIFGAVMSAVSDEEFASRLLRVEVQ